MKKNFVLLSLVIVLLISGCGPIVIDGSSKLISPSNTIITEERTVSEFTGIDFRTFGRVILTQGETESVTIQGSDNLVPVIQTTVRDGILVIQTEQNTNITEMIEQNVLTITIVVKDLKSLILSGAAHVSMDSLSTSKLEVTMSGAGDYKLSNLTAQSVNITVSGVGNVDLAGIADKAWINISGAGPVNAPDLKIGTANVNISGIGSATLWVTDTLAGTISGGGSVSYYGDPQVTKTVTGLGYFKSLGNK